MQYKKRFFSSLFFCLSATVFAATMTPPLVEQQPISVAMPSPAELEPRVIMIQTVHTIPEEQNDAAAEVKMIRGNLKPQVAFPGNIIRFTITNPLVFLKSRPTDQSHVVVYINGVALKGVSANWYSSVSNLQIANGKVPVFKNTASIDIALKRNDTTRDAWNFFYNNTAHFSDNHIDVDASIGWEGMSALEKDSSKTPAIRIVYYSSAQFIIWLTFFVIILVGFAFLAFKTNAIRDGDVNGAYSLSLTQLLFWTTLVIGAFIYTLVLTDITSSFNPSILYMLGISLTTTGVANTIDSSFNKEHPASPKKPHHHFFSDVLTSDGTNYSVQRIQIFAWNLLLGIYFISYTISNKSMPEFSNTLLFLAGFSSLSYLGAKAPENAAIKSGGSGADLIKPDVNTTNSSSAINNPAAVG